MDIKTIKILTRKLARIQIKDYRSLSEVKDDFDSVASSFIDLGLGSGEVTEALKKASDYFNLLSEDDYKANDQQKINESKAITSASTRPLAILLSKWRKELGYL